MNLVSVIIPCYNCEKWIERAIRSVLTQTYKEIEILLVDNNSTDNTRKILDDFGKLYPDKIKVYSQTKYGASAARNLGLSKAKGEWIQFLDADDELLPEKIEVQMSIVQKQDPDLIVDNYCKIHSGRKIKPTEIIKSKNDPWIGLIDSRLGITSSNLWKKYSIVKINGWKEGLASSQEYELLFRLLKTNPKIVVNHKVNTLIHAQPESISRTKNINKALKLIYNRYYLRKEIYKYLSSNNMLNDVYKHHLDSYLYFHLLLISEYNRQFFHEQCNEFNFKQMSVQTKLKIYYDFVHHSSKRKFVNSNYVFKGVEWFSYFFKNLNLLKY